MSAAEKEKTDSAGFRTSQLLQPELLSNDDLKTILKDRCIRIRRMDTLAREQLLALVHRVAVPLPQRNTSSELPVNPFLSAIPGESQSLGNCINFNHKKIKLKKSSDKPSPSNEPASKISKISLKRTESSSETKSSTEQETPPAKKNRSKITWP